MVDSPGKLRDFIVKILEDKGAQNITVLKLSDEVPLTTYMIFASGRSIKNISAIAEHIAYELKRSAKCASSIQGLNHSDWVLIDAGDVIVHIFHPEAREKFRLEELWTKKNSNS